MTGLRNGDRRLLAVTSEVPWPPDSGGHLRTFHVLRALAAEFPVTLIAGCRSRDVGGIAELEANGIEVLPAPIPDGVQLPDGLHAAASALRRRPYVLFERHDRAAVRTVIRRYCATNRPLAVYLDHLDSFVFEPLLGSLPRVMDLHNVYSLLVRREASESAWWARLYLRHEASLLAQMEQRAVRSVDAVLCVSDQELTYFRGLGARGAYLVPNGVDCASYGDLPTGRSAGQPLLLYIGSMSWGPNVDAAVFLAERVLPALRQRVPGVRLRIVGRDPAAAVRGLTRIAGVEVTGRVDDVRPHLGEATMLAVPLQAGGGTRLKILEAFAAGLPVISTAVGCEGLDVVDGGHLRIAEREQFADAAATMLTDNGLRRALAATARGMVRRQYDWSVIGALATAAVAKTLATAGCDAPRQRRAG